jgi:uracil-DNA glycosylase
MSQNSLFLQSLTRINSSWSSFLNSDTIELIKDIESKVNLNGKEFTPKPEKVLRFLETPLDQVKVIILGQDPYPQRGVATGRAFEVGTLNSWYDKFNNISLKNIVRAIYHAYNDEYLKYSEIKGKMDTGFAIKPPYEIFSSWEKQGVLLLNTSFTCEVGKSNSHEKIWIEFTLRLLNFIAESYPEITWFLWGNNAKSVVSDINISNKIESMHPMMCYDKPGREDDFLFGKINAFKVKKDKINWLG